VREGFEYAAQWAAEFYTVSMVVAALAGVIALAGRSTQAEGTRVPSSAAMLQDDPL
jgi:hypothetical protein